MTRNTYTGNGTTTDFTFTFTYLDKSHVLVTINGVATTAFTFFTSSTLRFTSAPANGSAIVIYRSTPSTTLLADFTAGSAIREQDLELDLQQVLNVAQELKTYVELQSTAGLLDQITAANTTASSALTSASSAVATANAASTTANGIAATASAANTTANTANTNATNAVNTANSISATATSAVNTATSAQTTANTAQARADRAPALGTAKGWNWNGLTTNTSLDFTSIPSWVKRITVMLVEVSAAGGYFYLQLGTSSGLETTNYVSVSGVIVTAPSANSLAVADGFNLTATGTDAQGLFSGSAILTLAGSNTWVLQSCLGSAFNARSLYSSGSKALSGTLDRIRVSTGSAFDSGFINIMYE